MKNTPSKLDFKHPEEWPLVFKLLAMLATLLIVLTLGYTLFVSSHQTKLNKNRAYYATMQENFAKTYGKFHRVKQFDINLSTNQQHIKDTIKQLQSSDTSTDIHSAIQQAARKSGITIRSFKTETTQSHNNFALTPLKLSAKASYHQAATFISLVANMPHVVIIGDFRLTKPTESNNGLLDFTITLKLYQPKELHYGKK